MSAIQDNDTPAETNDTSATAAANTMKAKFTRKTILRRGSDLAPFRPSPPVSSKSEASVQITDLAPLSRPRTREDEQIYVNTGKMSPTVKENPRFRRASAVSDGNESPLRTGFTNVDDTSADDEYLKIVDDFIDRLNIGKIGFFVKKLILYSWKRIQNSKFINSENDGRLHIQSFAIGVILTSIVIMIQPFLVVYFDSWVVLLGRLFKHLMAWVLVAVVISYIFKPKRKGNVIGPPSSSENTSPRTNHFDQKLQYKVKTSNHSSRSTSPNKHKQRPARSSTRPSYITRQSYQPSVRRNSDMDPYHEQLLLMNATERVQLEEKARYDQFQGAMDRPRDNYEKFMNVAYRKNQEVEIYDKFVKAAK